MCIHIYVHKHVCVCVWIYCREFLARQSLGKTVCTSNAGARSAQAGVKNTNWLKANKFGLRRVYSYCL